MAFMSIGQAISVATVVAAIVAGQVLFKLASMKIETNMGMGAFAFSLLSWQFVLAVTFYFIGTIFWVFVLQSLPLSRAYPLMASSFALVPILSYFLFGEPMSAKYFLGLVFFLIGLYILVTS